MPTLDSLLTALDPALDTLRGWVDAAVAHLPHGLVAFAVLALSWWVGRWVTDLTRTGLRRVHTPPTLVQLTTAAARTVVLLLGVFLALGVLDLQGPVMSLLAGLGVVGLALGFAFQDIAANLMSGVLVAVRRPLEPGDLVETNGFFATVEDVDLYATTLRAFTGERVTLPHRKVLESPLTNHSDTAARRVDLAVGVSYGEDLDAVEEAVREACEDLPDRAPGRDVDVWFTGYGGSSIDLSVRVWFDNRVSTAWLRGRSEMVKRIKAVFDREEITIPFPIRTLDFGDAGSTRLDQLGLAEALRDVDAA